MRCNPREQHEQLTAAESAEPGRASRRRWCALWPALVLAVVVPPARAGRQQYEPLADSVRLALAAQVSDSRPPVRSFTKPEERAAYIEWLGEMSGRLKPRMRDYRMRTEFLQTLDYEAARAGLDRQLILGLIQVESNFRRYAISSAGARGYMQVMPFWTRLIGDGNERVLFDMRANLRFGCVILRHYLDLERGNLFLALGRYNGSRGRADYPNAVRVAWETHWSSEPAARPPTASAPDRVAWAAGLAK